MLCRRTLATVSGDEHFFACQSRCCQMKGIIGAHEDWRRIQQTVPQHLIVFGFECRRQRHLDDVFISEIGEQIEVEEVCLSLNQSALALPAQKRRVRLISSNEGGNWSGSYRRQGRKRRAISFRKEQLQ